MKYLRQHKFVIRFINANLSRSQFLILSGILVGFSAGTVAIILKTIVHYIHILTRTQLSRFNYPYLNLVLPLVGILLTVWVIHKFLKGKDGRGIANILLDISQRSGVMPKFKMYAQVITSALTVGFGGSSGLEGPIAVTGAAIGSNYARTYRLSYRERILLLGCGVAAGISAIFNAPITGVMFAIEIILVGVVFSDFIPLIISAVTGALLSKIILDDSLLFEFKSLKEFNHHNVPYYILLGIACGLLSVCYSRISKKIEYFFHHYLKWNVYYKAIFGGLILAILCFVFPPLFGEGYDSVKLLASNNPEGILKGTFLANGHHSDWMIILFIGLIFLTKVIATSITLYSGGTGGNFAPALFTGAFLGFFYAILVNKLNLGMLPVNNFTLVGMCGIISGVMYAPLTGIFLIAEVTGGYDLIIPLMLVAISSYTIARIFDSHSMELKDLVSRKKIFTENHDENILSLIRIHEVVEKNYDVVSIDYTLTDLLALIRNSENNIIAVKDKEDNLEGFIQFDKVRKLLLDPELKDTLTVRELIIPSNFKANINDTIYDLIENFEKEDVLYIPVFENEILVGFISKTLFLTAYRNKLKLTVS